MSKNKLLLIFIIFLSIVLRLYRLGVNPPSLYWDEASLGYNAFTIATSGFDEHGELLPLDRFIAFGDYKPPGYIYTSVPSISLFGLNAFSIRLPSAIAGVVMVFITYLLVRELFKSELLGLLSGFLLSVSPWSIQFSRAAFEANLGAMFNLLAIYIFILSLRKKWLILFSPIFFLFSFYTFNANRIIAPLILLSLLLIFFRKTWQNKKWLFVSLIVSLILFLPSIAYLKSRESRLRFQEVSIFNNLEPLILSNQRIDIDSYAWWSKIIHNRRILYLNEFLKKYFDNFTGRFLFISGDVNPRLAVQDMGQLYFIELPLLLLGFFHLVKRWDKNFFLLASWMIIVPIPAALAKETPHALRTVSILPTYQIIIAYGLYHLLLFLRGKIDTYKNYLLFFVLCSLFFVNIYYYLHHYHIHYPIKWSGEWQYGYREVVEYVREVENDYDYIFVTEELGRPYIFFAFYNQIPLEEFLRSRQASRDWFGFWKVETIGKIRFGFDELTETQGRLLLVTTPNNLPGGYRILRKIINLSGQEVFWIAEKI